MNIVESKTIDLSNTSGVYRWPAHMFKSVGIQFVPVPGNAPSTGVVTVGLSVDGVNRFDPGAAATVSSGGGYKSFDLEQYPAAWVIVNVTTAEADKKFYAHLTGRG